MLAAALFVSPAAAEDHSALKPSSDWNLRYDDDKCRLVRSFGENENRVVLLLDQAGSEPYYTVSLVGGRVRQANGKVMRLQFGKELQTQRSFLKGRMEDQTPLVTMHGVNLAPIPPLTESDGQNPREPDSIGSEREAAIEQIAFRGGIDRDTTLETGPMGEAFAALRACAVDLERHLGIGDRLASAQNKPPLPKTNPGSWVTSDDYPRQMLQRDEEGVVRFRLTVDRTGRPTSCHITRSTRPQVFDDTVCLALLKRATFTPAQDHEGKAVASYWHSAVRFQMAD